MYMYVPSKFGNSGIMMITLNFLCLAWALDMRSLRASANLFLTPASGREEMKNWFCIIYTIIIERMGHPVCKVHVMMTDYGTLVCPHPITTLYHMYLFILG